MTTKEVAKRLGYRTAKEMFESVGYSDKQFQKLKPESKVSKLNDIVLNHFKISTDELLGLIEEYQDNSHTTVSSPS